MQPSNGAVTAWQPRRFGTYSVTASLPNVEVVQSEAVRLASVASRKLANYKELVARASDAFGDELKASRWLSLPNPELNGESPLQFAMKDGYELRGIEPILVRIEHGIYL